MKATFNDCTEASHTGQQHQLVSSIVFCLPMRLSQQHDASTCTLFERLVFDHRPTLTASSCKGTLDDVREAVMVGMSDQSDR